MKASNRDLLVLVKDEFLNQQEMELQVERLNSLLYQSETIDTFCIAHEIFDIGKHKIIDSRKKITQIIHQPVLKPFRFLFNKN